MFTALRTIVLAIREWLPSELFRSNEVGVWYDPSDATTLFADSAGTTAAVLEGPVGLMLDKSKGLVLGSELVVGANTGNNGWTPIGSGGVKVSSGATGSLYQAVIPAVNVTYVMTIVVSAISGTLTPQVGNATSTAITTVGTHIRRITPTSGTVYYIDAPAATTATVDSVSIKQLPGAHASQSTSTRRPRLTARKNWLLGTETLATQNVTTRAAQQVLSFCGTGTVTLTGTSTAGPLVGTGVADRVSLTFTPTAGTLTLTVSGSVTQAQLEDSP